MNVFDPKIRDDIDQYLKDVFFKNGSFSMYDIEMAKNFIAYQMQEMKFFLDSIKNNEPVKIGVNSLKTKEELTTYFISTARVCYRDLCFFTFFSCEVLEDVKDLMKEDMYMDYKICGNEAKDILKHLKDDYEILPNVRFRVNSFNDTYFDMQDKKGQYERTKKFFIDPNNKKTIALPYLLDRVKEFCVCSKDFIAQIDKEQIRISDEKQIEIVER